MAILLLLMGQLGLAGAALAGGLIAAGLIVWRKPLPSPRIEPIVVGPDYSLVGSALGLGRDPAALTTSEGSLLIVNAAYRERFGGSRPPLSLGIDDEARSGLEMAKSMASRDGAGCVAGIGTEGGLTPVEVERVGAHDDLLLWRFPGPSSPDALTTVIRRIQGVTGSQIAAAGVLAAVVDTNGKLLAGNAPFLERALGPGQRVGTVDFRDLVEADEQGEMRLVAEGESGGSLRAVHISADPTNEAGGAGTFLLFDRGQAGTLSQSSNLQALLDVLPIGLALVDRDGRFLTMNQAFRQAGGLKGSALPVYPGDLVVKEDKAAVADAVRRNSPAARMSGDLAVRLADQTAEPVALTIAGLRGLGDAAVLLLLKDNSEEAKLKRQVAQATKMQAVGQLAGGVAHDFNNILTAIIGHCDLMLMRHTPGDSDYDDIQQIKSNSNRAAGLTRQLLAFSRQQTLRPQVLQLPDVVSEVSHLLKRLLGETVELVVKHGRNLGPVRADPGQLEQVIVNLAVNARDAMAAKGGGTLTIQTYSVQADQVAELGSDILPVADYTRSVGHRHRLRHPAARARQDFRALLHHQGGGQGHRPWPFDRLWHRQAVGRLHLRRIPGRARARASSSTCPCTAKRPGAASAAQAAKPKQDELWGSGHGPAGRGRGDGPQRRRARADPPGLYGDHRRQWRGRAGSPRPRRAHDLLISDVVMPGMDGPTMVREARKSWPDLPILFMSGYAEEQLRKSIDIDNVNFLPKPFSVTELAEAARRTVGTK